MIKQEERERIVFKPDEEDRVILKDGKKYRLLKETVEGGHIKEVIFEEFDESAMGERMDKIADYLVSASKIDARMIIKDLLKQMDTDAIGKLEKQVKRQEPVVIVPGCLSLKIGKRRVIEVIR